MIQEHYPEVKLNINVNTNLITTNDFCYESDEAFKRFTYDCVMDGKIKDVIQCQQSLLKDKHLSDLIKRKVYSNE